ncbi:MAG: hypothetical protein EOP82_26810 [Variovorax sp.]|nr:MAG: hypothetical protein EOP82_26810 [Variovorax sp.]
MPIDRRTFVLGSGVAAAGGALASFAAVVAVEQKAGPVSAAVATAFADVVAAPSFELRILGWDRSDGHTPLASMPAGDARGWIAIDSHWRVAWH